MLRNTIIFSVLLLSVITVPVHGYAKTYAWVLGNETAQQLDVDANKIVQNVVLKGNPSMIPDLKGDAIIVDVVGNLLFTINGSREEGWIGVYSLNDLSYKKDLDIKTSTEIFTPCVLAPPVGDKFYVEWWDAAKAGVVEVDGATISSSKGGERYFIYDKGSLNKITEAPGFNADLFCVAMVSADGKTLYDIDNGGGPNEIKAYDSQTLQLKETISLSGLWDTPIFTKTAEYWVGDKILFFENPKASADAPSNYKYFVYDLSTRERSRKVSVQEKGEMILSPDGKKLVVDEEGKRRIHIYDMVSGQKVKTLDFTNDYPSESTLYNQTISPDSTKLYLTGDSAKLGKDILMVVDLTSTYSVTAEIPNVSGYRMFFFDAP